jgi:5-methylcytosine-specific restriction endonuclease McrA
MTKREKIYQKFNGRCAYCGRKITLKEMQVDHYYPKHMPSLSLAYGGFDVESFKNMMPSCRACNHYKWDDLPENFRDKMKTLHERLGKIYLVRVAINFGIVKIKPFDGKFYFERFIQL